VEFTCPFTHVRRDATRRWSRPRFQQARRLSTRPSGAPEGRPPTAGPKRSDRAAARRRIVEASEQVPAAAAVKYVIDNMAASVAVVA
jgi:hypothetical protein